MRLLLLRTSAASNSPHLTLHHAYARLVDLKSQLRHLQAAAAAEAAQQLQEQLQAQRQQAQPEKAQAAEHLAEVQASSPSPHPDCSATAAETMQANGSPSAHQVRSSSEQQRTSSLQPNLHHSKQPLDHSSGNMAASTLVKGFPGTQPAQQPPAASASTAAAPSLPIDAPESLLTGKAVQPSKLAPKGLLEIQAEQEAEAARNAEAARAVPSGRHGKGKQKSDGTQSSQTAGASQPGQARVLQVGSNLSPHTAVLAGQSIRPACLTALLPVKKPFAPLHLEYVLSGVHVSRRRLCCVPRQAQPDIRQEFGYVVIQVLFLKLSQNQCVMSPAQRESTWVNLQCHHCCLHTGETAEAWSSSSSPARTQGVATDHRQQWQDGGGSSCAHSRQNQTDVQASGTCLWLCTQSCSYQ